MLDKVHRKPKDRAARDRDAKAAASCYRLPLPARLGGIQRSRRTSPSRRRAAEGVENRAPILGWLYGHSLGIALAMLFILSFVAHWLSSVSAANQEASAHGGPHLSALQYLADARFWFESFQNWQSEFLSTAVLVVLSIFLRFRGSPESKPVAAPHSETGAS